MDVHQQIKLKSAFRVIPATNPDDRHPFCNLWFHKKRGRYVCHSALTGNIQRALVLFHSFIYNKSCSFGINGSFFILHSDSGSHIYRNLSFQPHQIQHFQNFIITGFCSPFLTVSLRILPEMSCHNPFHVKSRGHQMMCYSKLVISLIFAVCMHDHTHLFVFRYRILIIPHNNTASTF